MALEYCRKCKFYKDNNLLDPSGYGKCRRFPKHTDTNDKNWCGEYAAKELPTDG